MIPVIYNAASTIQLHRTSTKAAKPSRQRIRHELRKLAWGIAALGIALAPGAPTLHHVWAGDQLFPFLVSYDAPDNATNISGWLAKPAGGQGFVQVRDGHFVTNAGPIRFWATNFCFDACFPEHDQAERVAARLARFGINCVRMHHMDSRSIWGQSDTKLQLDPSQLEKLDYLIFQLKKNGIYTNLNLHVSRTFGRSEGFPIAGNRPNYDKGVDNFEPQMILLQKKYAADLLTHVNPYTGHAYGQEPAIAMVEINNENALFNQWSRGELDELEDPYATTFRHQWNDWLRQKYGSTTELKKKWEVGQAPLGSELLDNGSFAEPLGRDWHLEQDDQTLINTKRLAGGPKGGQFLRIEIERKGRVSWRPQMSQSGLSLEQGKPYTLSCTLRSKQPRQVSWNCMMAHEPWERLGLSATCELGPEWTRFEFTFVAEQDDSNARITLTGLEPGSVDLADVSFRPGGIIGLAPGKSLEDDSIPVMQRRQANWTAAARRDFIDFLWDTEQRYWLGMYRYLKQELDVQPPVSGTQLSYSPIHIQAQLDYIDAHSYWQHPRFPGRAWDSRNWYVLDQALVNEPSSTLTSLAARRIHGFPFTVSEYNHPAPLSYQGETFLMLSAFAAFQNWDGIFSFAYCHNRDFEPQSVHSYFDLKANAVKLVHLPACAAMYLRGDVAPADATISTPLTEQDERESLYLSGDPWRLARHRFETDPRQALRHRVELELTPDVPASARPRDDSPLQEVVDFVSDTGQLRWNVEQPQAGYFIADTPHSKMFTGFIRNRMIELGDVELSVGPTMRDWACISLVCLDGQRMTEPGRVLIAASGQMQNTGAKLEERGEHQITLQAGWGREPLLCEGIPARLSLPVNANRVQFFALDAAGNRRQAIPVSSQRDRTILHLSPDYRTLWYEAIVR